MCKPTHSPQITLIGAGLAGCLLSIYLAKRGFQVDIYERRSDIRKEEHISGRSINLTLSAKGARALKETGLYQQVLKFAVPLEGRIIHLPDGTQKFQSYGQEDTDFLYALPRNKLNSFLLNAAEKYELIKIHFNKRCSGIDFLNNQICLQDEISNEEREYKFSVIIATDGSNSSVRKSMQAVKDIGFSKSYLSHGYKEAVIAPSKNGSLPLEKNALHVWPRGQYMINGFPNLNKSLTCILFAPLRGAYSIDNLVTEDKTNSLFQGQFPGLLRLAPDLEERYFSSKTGHLETIRCESWHFENKALLLGDAAHAIVPFHGQGMNCAFEDCAELNRCLDLHGNDWHSVFREFEGNRKANTNAIADLSLQNYTELRNNLIDPKFFLKKEVEKILSKKYPNYFVPRFSMVCFRLIPYLVAKERGAIQYNIVEELCETVNYVEKIDWKSAERLIGEKLVKL